MYSFVLLGIKTKTQPLPELIYLTNGSIFLIMRLIFRKTNYLSEDLSKH